MRTLILCLGDERVADDGIGAEIGRILQSLPLPESIQVRVAARLRMDILDELAAVDHLVIVDALAGDAKPGSCTVADVTQHTAALVASGCYHASDVRDLIHLAREVAPAGPECSVTIAGVEGEYRDRHGWLFSYAARSAVPRLVDLLLMVTGAGLKIRLLASDTLRREQRPQCVASPSYEWNEANEQAAYLQ